MEKRVSMPIMLSCRNVLWPNSVKHNVNSPRKEKTYNWLSIKAFLVFLRPLCISQNGSARDGFLWRLIWSGARGRVGLSVSCGRRASKTAGTVWSRQGTVVCEHIALRVVLLSWLSSHNSECFSLSLLSPKTPNCFFPRFRRIGYWHHISDWFWKVCFSAVELEVVVQQTQTALMKTLLYLYFIWFTLLILG